MAASSDSSYCDEWQRLFEPTADQSMLISIRRCCFAGQLQGSRFRGVCWRVLLQCLPLDIAHWERTLQQSRAAYDKLKSTVSLNPRNSAGQLDPAVDNPLSLQSESPWQQYFADSELRASIHQDVERTFPELEYFQSLTTRAMMEDVLFVYGRQNPHIAYKQGMHEILGPLLFVLFFDQQSYAHCSEQGGLTSLSSQTQATVQALNDQRFLEHDAFFMFSQIMRIIEPWYVSGEERAERQRKTANDSDAPFSRAQDSGPTSALITKLNWIGDNLLRQADPQLYKHLESLDIAPQIYGIRWLRLLFGREFPIQDLLFLWDAIFADGAPFVLVDFIFVTMLIYIRELLLHSDYTGSLHYLMRYPPAVDVHCFLALALHLRSPKSFSKPKQYAFMNFSHITVAGRPHPNINRDQRSISPAAPSQRTDLATSVGKSLEKTGTKVLTSINRVGNMVVDSLKDNDLPPRSSSVSARSGGGSLSARSSPSFHRRPTSDAVSVASGEGSRRSSAVTDDDLELIKEQVGCLQTRLNEVDHVARIAAERIAVCAGAIAKSLTAHNIPANDAAATAVAELRDISNRLVRASTSEQRTRAVSTNVSIGRSPVEVARDAVRAPDGVISSQLTTKPAESTPRRPPPPSRKVSSPTSPQSALSGKLTAENELREIKYEQNGQSSG